MIEFVAGTAAVMVAYYAYLIKTAEPEPDEPVIDSDYPVSVPLCRPALQELSGR